MKKSLYTHKNKSTMGLQIIFDLLYSMFYNT